MSKIIDWHSHFSPPGFTRALRERTTSPYVRTDADGNDLLFVLSESRPFPPSYFDPEVRLKSLDEAGIDRQVICWPGIDALPATESVPLARVFNESAAELVRAYPERFSAFASLPLEDPKLAARELVWAHEAGLIGAVVPSEIFASVETARRYELLLETANRLRSHLFVHPRFVPGPGEPPLVPPGIDHAFQRIGNLVVQDKLTAAYFTLSLTDLLDPYSDIIVHLANLGGALPFLVERLEAGKHHYDGPPLIDRLRRIYVDVSSFGPRAIGFVREVLGADRLLLGTDQPVFLPKDRVDAVLRTVAPSGDNQRILENTLGRTF
jgi:aminocarboxymuconate-semialdehyde decarboxylase